MVTRNVIDKCFFRVLLNSFSQCYLCTYGLLKYEVLVITRWQPCLQLTLCVVSTFHNSPMYFIQPTTCDLYNILYYYQRSTCFGRAFRPSSGAYKAVCATHGFQLIHTSGRQQESMTTTRTAHTVL
jgi:hypothetical protein